MHSSELRQRRVGLLGLGREGLATLGWLQENAPELALSVYAEAEPPLEARARLRDGKDRLVIGPLAEAPLQDCDVLFRSPGISPYRTELDAFRRAGGQLTSASSLWFAEHPGARTLCITGTKGKSTTSALVAHLLRAAGLSVELAGNFGPPMLERADASPDWWVIELSSYQLADLEARPSLGAVLNLSDEHLDWHGGAAAYRRDKLRLARLLDRRPLVANYADESLRDTLASHPQVHWFQHEDGWRVSGEGVVHRRRELDALKLARLPGRHNLANLTAALTLVEQVTELPPDLDSVLAAFGGLPHRLHTLGRQDGIRYVDDSLSTTPVATLAALEALAGEPVVVLIGGLDRGLDWGALAARFNAAAPHALVALPDNGPRVVAQLSAAGFEPPGGFHSADNLANAVRTAQRLLPQGGTVLLSPGAPSFPQFANYVARGKAFATACGLSDLGRP